MSKEPKRLKKLKLVKRGFCQRDNIPAPIRKDAVIFCDLMIRDITGTEDDLTGAQLILCHKTGIRVPAFQPIP